MCIRDSLKVDADHVPSLLGLAQLQIENDPPDTDVYKRQVQVLKVDYDAHKGERISLSLKALAKSAWDRLTGDLKEGVKRSGKVKRVEPFGAFVELSPGVSGLIHVTAMGGKRHAPPGELIKVDDEVEVEILGIDQEKHRISLKRVPSVEETAERLSLIHISDENIGKARKNLASLFGRH